MDIKELHSFKMSDAVKFHDKLNPNLWRNNHLDPAVRKQLILIAEDFLSNMGISGLDVKDITVSGSSAAYSYTPHSDLDLHILVDMSKLPNDEVYRELFNAKKTLYNDSHNIKVKGVPVELYVQDSNEPVVSLGEYSILDDKWLKIPSKRRANLDQNATKAKYDKLAGLVDLALKSRNLERVKDTIKTIKRYRQAGLDKFGEFGPENLAYKAVRSQGAIDALYNLRDELHGEELSIEEMYSGPKMKFLRPGELKGSYTDYDLLLMGFKKSQNGSWYIPQSKWDKLVAAQKIGESYNLDEAIDRDSAIEQIRKLRNTSGRTPAEIEAARSIINRLAQKFNITNNDLETVTKNPYQAKIDQKSAERRAAAERVKAEYNRMKDAFTGKVSSTFSKFAEDDMEEDYDPNGPPPGPEFKPTMPAGTVKVDVSDTYDWYKLGQHISNLDGLGKHDFGKGPPSTIMAFGDEDTEHKYIDALQKTGLTTTDIDPVDPNQPKGMKRQKVDPTYNVSEDETMQYAAEKTAKINPYGGMKDRQYRGAISEDSTDIKFTQEPYEGWNGMGAMITAYSDGNEIGHVIFEPTDNDKNKWYATEVEVEDQFQRKGIATTMYDMAKKLAQKSNAVIVPSHAQTSDAKGMWKDKKVWEASGYIPSAKEKNDPRFKTALTVDVKPDAIKKNAKAFSWLTSRAGIPPDARTDGKVK